MKRFYQALCLAALCFAASAQADWQLNNDRSELSFVSIKAANIAEVHRFKTLKGGVDGNGKATIIVDLASVDTMIPIRDERMQKYLFNTVQFPVMQVEADVASVLKQLKSSAAVEAVVKAKVSLHGVERELELPLLVAKLNDGSVLVSTTRPVLVNAADFALVEGVDKLRSIAGLSSISYAVPVSLTLHLRHL